MKTQVIQLDEADDLASIRDKMSWAKAGRILLVFPHRKGVRARSLDLVLLKRHAARQGAQLAVVTRAADASAHCARLGIPVFTTASAAQREEWGGKEIRTPSSIRENHRPDLRELKKALVTKRPAWENKPAIRILLFSVGILASLAIFLLFIPSATITYNPRDKVQSLEIDVSARQDTAVVNITGILPYRLANLEILGNKVMEVTSEKVVPDGFAEGLVIFENLTEEMVGIPQGTSVRTLDTPVIRFLTLQDAVLPSGIGNQVTVQVRAVEPGVQGNVPAGSLVVIDGDLGTSLVVENSEAFLGGSEKSKAVPTESDRAALMDLLLADMLTDCATSFSENSSEGQQFFIGKANLDEIIEQTFFPGEAVPGNFLSLTMSIRCSQAYIVWEDLQVLARSALDATLPVGFVIGPHPVEVEILTDPVQQEDGSWKFKIFGSRILHARVDQGRINLLLAGKPVEMLPGLIAETIELDMSPESAIDPSWWPWMPLVPMRIHHIVIND